MKIYWGTLFKKCDSDKDKFPFGITFYDAPQGGGKSLSMCFDALELQKQFPDLFLISNMKINGWGDNCIYFNSPKELANILQTPLVPPSPSGAQCLRFVKSKNKSSLQPQNSHSLIIIDEALSYFAENGGIDPGLMSEITQNRKQRRLMFIATQKFKRTNNRLRDFSLRTVKCRNIFNFQINQVRDDQTVKWDKDEMDFVGKKIETRIFKRNNDLFSRFDTFAKTKIDFNARTDTLFTPARAPAQAEVKSDKKGNSLWLK